MRRVTWTGFAGVCGRYGNPSPGTEELPGKALAGLAEAGAEHFDTCSAGRHAKLVVVDNHRAGVDAQGGHLDTFTAEFGVRRPWRVPNWTLQAAPPLAYVSLMSLSFSCGGASRDHRRVTESDYRPGSTFG